MPPSLRMGRFFNYFKCGVNFHFLKTGSGKTYTMGSGAQHFIEQDIGILPRVIRFLFAKLKETELQGATFAVYVEFM